MDCTAIRILRPAIVAALRRVIAAVTVLLVLGVGARSVLAGEETVGADTVRWDEGLDRVGEQATRLLPQSRREALEQLGLPTQSSPLEVVIVRGHDRMSEVAEARVPAWAVGVAVSSRSLIVIREDLLTRGFGGGLGPVLRHECVHIAWGRFSGAQRRLLPLWTEEGVAETIGGGISVDAGATLDIAAGFDRLIPFVALAERFPKGTRDADLAYKQSRSWVQFFVREAGWDTLRAVLSDLRESNTVPAASAPGTLFAERVRARTGIGLGEWHAAWLLYVRERARPWYHLLYRDVPALVLTCLAAFACVGFFWVRGRRRKQMAQLPDGDLPA